MQRWLGPAVLTVVFAAYAYFMWPERTPPDNFSCVLKAKQGNQTRTFGKLREHIVAVRIVGLTTRAKADGLYNFKGTATLTTATKSVDGSVDGNVFVDKAGRPEGLLLRMSSSDLGSDELEITTLNKDGMLDYSYSEAFLHVGPNLGIPDRLSYPVAMACRVKLSE